MLRHGRSSTQTADTGAISALYGFRVHQSTVAERLGAIGVKMRGPDRSKADAHR